MVLVTALGCLVQPCADALAETNEFPPRTTFTIQQDQQAMLDLVGIRSLRPGANTTNVGQFMASLPWSVAWSDSSTNVADANGLWLFTGNATTTNGYYRSYVR